MLPKIQIINSKKQDSVEIKQTTTLTKHNLKVHDREAKREKLLKNCDKNLSVSLDLLKFVIYSSFVICQLFNERLNLRLKNEENPSKKIKHKIIMIKGIINVYMKYCDKFRKINKHREKWNNFSIEERMQNLDMIETYYFHMDKILSDFEREKGEEWEYSFKECEKIHRIRKYNPEFEPEPKFHVD